MEAEGGPLPAQQKQGNGTLTAGEETLVLKVISILEII